MMDFVLDCIYICVLSRPDVDCASISITYFLLWKLFYCASVDCITACFWLSSNATEFSDAVAGTVSTNAYGHL